MSAPSITALTLAHSYRDGHIMTDLLTLAARANWENDSDTLFDQLTERHQDDLKHRQRSALLALADEFEKKAIDPDCNVFDSSRFGDVATELREVAGQG